MKGQVLIIDDNRMDIKALSGVLERNGFASYGFTEAGEALDWLSENRPSMIFLDLQMPQVSGFDLIKVLRKRPDTATVPIMIVSGKNQSDDVLRAIQTGANDYVVKPVDPLVLQEKLRKSESVQDPGFNAINVGGEEGFRAFFAREIRILAVSEFGVRVSSDTSLAPSETVEIAGVSAEFFGSTRLVLRCLTCERDPHGAGFLMQMTFVGMSESQRQVIRKNCRAAWIRSKPASA